MSHDLDSKFNACSHKDYCIGKIADLQRQLDKANEKIKQYELVADAEVNQVADLQAKLDAANNPWIDVNERLPEERLICVVHSSVGTRTAHMYQGRWLADGYGQDEVTVTHWMPIPPRLTGGR